MVSPSDVIKASVKFMNQPWSWGESDCCHDVGKVYEVLYGFDPMIKVRGLWSSKTEALRYALRQGGMRKGVFSVLEPQGFVEGKQGREATGDLALVSVSGSFGGAMAICVDNGLWVAKAKEGLILLPKCEVFWCHP